MATAFFCPTSTTSRLPRVGRHTVGSELTITRGSSDRPSGSTMSGAVNDVDPLAPAFQFLDFVFGFSVLELDFVFLG